MKKRVLSLLLGLLLVCCAAFSLTACSGKDSVKIVVDNEIVATAELGSSFTVPSAHLVNGKNNKVDGVVEIVVKNPNGIIIATSAMEIDAEKIGDYEITYSSANVESLVRKVKVQDTTGPIITANDVFYNLFKDQAVTLPTTIIEDISNVDYTTSTLKVYKKDNPSKEYAVSNMGTFVPDEVGEYVYVLEVCDTFGNKATKEWEFFIADKTWMADDATGKMIASFDNGDYANVFGGGTATDRQGNPDVEILDEFQGETGVAKVSMNYFNHNFGYYSSFNLRFPRTYTFEEGKRIAIKMYIEQSSINLERFNIMPFEHTHITAIGVNVLGYLPVQEGAWFTAVLPSNVLKDLADENGVISGVQLDVRQADAFSGTKAQVVYIASITEIEQLATPVNVVENGNKIVWNAVANANAYEVSINGENQIVTVPEIAKPEGGYKIKVKAVGDGVIYEDSQYSLEITNMLPTPTGLTMSASKVVSWTAVSGSQGYVLDINGEIIDVGTDTAYTFDKPENSNYIIKVKAKGNGNPYYDSDYAGIVVRYVGLDDGYIADFADETYVYDVCSANIAYNCVEFGMVASSYSAEYLESYDGAEGVLKIKITSNVDGWGVVALKLPQTLNFENLDTLSIRFRVEGVAKGPNKGLRLYGYGGDTAARGVIANTLDAQLNDWYTITIGRKGAYEGLEYGFNKAKTSDYILFGVALMPSEKDFYIYLDEITAEYKDRLATPQNLQTSNGVLTWDAVEGAESYIITINGEEEVVMTNSYQLPDSNYTLTVKAQATGFIESYESVQMNKRQEVIGDLATTLDANTYAKFDDSRYVYCFENTALNDKVATAEIIDDVKGEYDKVLHISGNGGYNKFYIYLPKALPANFTIQYRMIATATSADYIWEVMTAAEAWAYAWRSATVEEWTSYNITAGYGYEGKDKLVIGVNNVGNFDLYIAIIEKPLTAEEIKANLTSKLGDNELARFDEKGYVSFVNPVFYNANGTATYNLPINIVEDAEKGKVVRISSGDVPAGSFGTINLSLLKAITSKCTITYKVVASPVEGMFSSVALVHGLYPGWDYAWGMGYEGTWKQLTTDSYAGKDALSFYVNGLTSFEIYFSIIYNGEVSV